MQNLLGQPQPHRCDDVGEHARQDVPEDEEEKPRGQTGHSRSRGLAEDDGKDHGQRQPHAAIEDRRQQEKQQTGHGLAAGRHAQPDKPQADDQQPDHCQHQGQGEERCQEFPEQQSIPVDGLGEDAGHSAAVKLAVDGVEGERNGYQGHQNAQEFHKGGDGRLADGEEFEKQEGITADGFTNLRHSGINRAHCGQQNQHLEDAHAGAGEQIGHLLEHHRPQARPRRSLAGPAGRRLKLLG